MITGIAALYLLWVAWNQQFELAVMQLLLTACLLCYADGGLTVLSQAWHLLRWLLLPIVLLHAFFTPGALLIADLPLTQEGVQKGGWLALHLSSLYLAAMLFSRLLSLHLLMRLAACNRHSQRLVPIYIRLLPPIMQGIQTEVQQHAQQWRAQGHAIRQLPRVLLQLVIHMEQQSRTIAQKVASDWPSAPIIHDFRIPKQRAMWVCWWLGGSMLGGITHANMINIL